MGDQAVTLDKIAKRVCAELGLRLAEIQVGDCRKKRVVLARSAIAYIARRNSHTLKEIRDFFGLRSHGSVAGSIERMTLDIQDDWTVGDRLDAMDPLRDYFDMKRMPAWIETLSK